MSFLVKCEMRLAMKGVQYEVSENVLKTRPNVSKTGIKTFFFNCQRQGILGLGQK